MESYDLTKLDNWVAHLVERISPAERRKLLRSIATTLRSRNQERIRAQVNVDGSRYAPRRRKLRAKKGKLRDGAMFTKLRQNRYLRITATSDEASISIPGRAGLLARIHHYGLRDFVSREQRTQTIYTERQILGISREDEVLVKEMLLQHLASL
jgi:phage virion morphogenesis protein